MNLGGAGHHGEATRGGADPLAAERLVREDARAAVLLTLREPPGELQGG